MRAFLLPLICSATLLAFPLLAPAVVAVPSLDLGGAVLVESPTASPVERKAGSVLVEEEARRTGIAWKRKTSASGADMQVVLAQGNEVVALLPAALRTRWTNEPGTTTRSEGFTIRTLRSGKQTAVVIAGNDNRGVLFGAGYLLRKMEMEHGHATLPADINISTAPQYPVRGHQIGYRFKNNTYDAWTATQFDQQTRDLAVFGNNAIQVIAPDSDDADTSPLFHAQPLDVMVEMCKSTVAYGLDFDLYYPEMAKDYSIPAVVNAEVAKAERLFRALPHIDAFYVPSGDPGHTEPKFLLPLVEKEAAVLHKFHPKATVWISTQGYQAAWYDEFYKILNDQHPAFITGFFVGPQSRDSFPLQREKIPAQYQLQAYPDIAHAMHSQFAMPDWDPAFAFSEGREPIDPRPLGETTIYRNFASLHSGFITYSEGVNDDVNKFVWDQLGWSASADPMETLRDYSRFFIGPHIGTQGTDAFAQGILALEQNWIGPLISHSSVTTTLAQFRQLEADATPEQRTNWRFNTALYRAYYDEYIHQRLLLETTQEQAANEALRKAPATGSAQAIKNARRALIVNAEEWKALRTRIEELADALFHEVGLQLSVAKYGASAIERGANLDRVDVQLNNRAWLERQFTKISAQGSETERSDALAKLARYADPGPGGFYDDLGDPTNEPHLLRGKGEATDPQLYATTVNGIADKVPDDGLRISTITYAETLYDTPVEIKYERLDATAHYKLRVTYGGEDYTLPIRLVANEAIEIQSPFHRESNPMTVEYDLPLNTTSHGELDLKWTRPAGIGGGGRGLQIAEVWLIPSR